MFSKMSSQRPSRRRSRSVKQDANACTAQVRTRPPRPQVSHDEISAAITRLNPDCLDEIMSFVATVADLLACRMVGSGWCASVTRMVLSQYNDRNPTKLDTAGWHRLSARTPMTRWQFSVMTLSATLTKLHVPPNGPAVLPVLPLLTEVSLSIGSRNEDRAAAIQLPLLTHQMKLAPTGGELANRLTTLRIR